SRGCSGVDTHSQPVLGVCRTASSVCAIEILRIVGSGPQQSPLRSRTRGIAPCVPESIMSRPNRWEHLRKDYLVLIGLVLSLNLYISSFFLRVTELQVLVNGSPNTYYGWEAFQVVSSAWTKRASDGRIRSWDAVIVLTGWVPNPLLWAGLVCLGIGRMRTAASLGIAAVLAALSNAFTWFHFDFRYLLEGYYCWVMSMIVLTVVAAIRSVRPSAQDYLTRHFLGGAYLNAPVSTLDESVPPPTR